MTNQALIRSLIQNKTLETVWTIPLNVGIGQKIWEQAHNQIGFSTGYKVNHFVRDRVYTNISNIARSVQQINCNFNSL